MKLTTVKLTHELPEKDVAALAGQSIGAGHYTRLIDPFTIYLKPNGQFLCLWLKDRIPLSLQRDAYRVLQHKSIAPPGSAAHRPTASGHGADRKAGTGIIGCFDRDGRHHPYARKTAFTKNYPHLFKQFLPYCQKVNDLYKEALLEIHGNQAFAAAFTDPAWLIEDTVFSTVQVKKGFRTHVHTDGNNLHNSVAPMTCFTNAQGCELIFPKYEVAVPYGNGDLLLANVHEWHGNGPLLSDPATSVRITCIFYLRARMPQCGPPEAELKRYRNRKVGDPVFGWLLRGMRNGVRGWFFVPEKYKGELDFEDPVSLETDEFPEESEPVGDTDPSLV